MQHAAARSTRQRRPLFTPLPARAVSWPPLDTAGAPSPSYKRPPFFPENIHTTSLSLLDIVSQQFASQFELAGARRAPGHAAIPGDSEPPPTYRRSRAAEKDSLRRRDTPPSPPVLSAPSPAAVLLPVTTAVSPLCLEEEDDPDTDSGCVILTGGPLRLGPLFFPFFSRAHLGSLAGPARVWVAGPF
jgi:hypothetical protein